MPINLGIVASSVAGATPLSLSYADQQFTIGSNSESLNPTVSGGDGTKSYAVTNGTLPPNTSLNSSTGAITGPATAQWDIPPVATSGSGNVYANYVDTLPDGSAIVAGYFSSWDATFGSTTLTKAGGTNTGFAAKVSSTGAWSWAVATGTATTGSTTVSGVSTTSDGGAIVTGYFETASVAFGSTTLTKAGGVFTGFAAKVSSTGTWSWAVATGTATTGSTMPIGVSATSDDGAIITGIFQTASVTFGSTTLTKAGGANTGFAAKVSSTGAWSWAVATGTASTGSPTLRAAASTSDGGAIIVGHFITASVTFGSNTLTKAGGANTGFAAKVSSTGSWSWAVATGTASTGSATLRAVSTTSDDGAIVTGFFVSASVTFGSTTLNLTGGSGAYTGFAAKVSSTGSWSWAVANGSAAGGLVYPQGVSVTSDDGAIIAGYFTTGDVTFGSATATKAGGTNTGFVAKVTSTGSWSWAAASGTATTGSTTPLWVASTPDGGAVIAGYFATADVTFGSTTLTKTATNTGFAARVSSTGTWNMGAPGFPSTVRITLTDSSGSTFTDVTLTAQ